MAVHPLGRAVEKFVTAYKKSHSAAEDDKQFAAAVSELLSFIRIYLSIFQAALLFLNIFTLFLLSPFLHICPSLPLSSFSLSLSFSSLPLSVLSFSVYLPSSFADTILLLSSR